MLAPGAHAQFNASLRGTVSDPSGAVIPGATVTLTNKDTNRTQTATSDGSGIYTFNSLGPASYSLMVAATGFKSKTLAQVQITPEQANTINVTMEVGAAAQTVTVTSLTRGLPTDTATLSATISSNQIQHMPSFNRDVFQLAQLTPGVFGDASQGSGGGSYELPGNQGPSGTDTTHGGIFETENGPQVQSLGGQYETNGISVDGISTTSAVWGGTSVITPSEDSVEDMHVVSNSYDAENGRFSGAQIEVTTKGGTNSVHGSAFFKASRPGLNAYQRWNGQGSNQAPTGTTDADRAASRGVNRDNSRFNQYGGSLGGPFWKNKLFGFFNYETSPLSSVQTSQGWYETSQFDALTGTAPVAGQYLAYKGEAVAASAMVPRTCASIGLTEGVNCATTAGGLDVGSPLTSGAGAQDLTYGGSSTAPGVGGGLDGVPDLAYYTTANPTTTSQAQYNGRLDADITSRDRLTFTIYWVPLDSTYYNGPVRSANLWHHSQINDAFSLIWNHTFSATLLNQARANAAGYRWNEVSSNPQEPFGLPQDSIDAIGTIGSEGGFQYFGAPGPSDLNQWTYSYNDVLTKVWGKQNIKAGGELTRLYYLNDPIYAARPSFNFHNLWDFANDAPYKETGTFDYATGVPFANRQDERENLWGFFVQDDIKLRPNLTINAGLRWSYFAAYQSKENNLDVMQFGTGANPLDGLNLRVGGGLYTPSKNNWGPQIGFDWQPMNLNGKAVIRGGFGINYNQNEIAILANGFGNPPNAVSPNFTCAYPFPNPTCAGTGILYETATNINSIFGYAPNPAAITTFSSTNLPVTGSTSITGFPAHPKTITDYHYSLEADYQLPASTVATLSYEGTQMRHLLTQYDWLAVAAQQGLALNPSVNFIDYYDNAANSNYNGMVATLTHNFANHFQAEAQYTWGKAMDEQSGPYFEDPYPYDVHAAYGRSAYDVQNAVKLFGLWQPVFFHGNSWGAKTLGGWSLSGIWNWHTGFPWDPVYNTTGNLYYGSSPYSSIRPAARVLGYGRDQSNENYMNATNPNFGTNGTAYFPGPTYTVGPAFPAAVAGPAPGIHRDSLTGPDYNDLDGSLAKDFGLPNNRILGEHAVFEVRADAYNFFNKININTATIHNVLGTAAPDGTVTPSPGFGTAGGALGGRTVQLQARFSF
ncbi:MAG TPA: carboxypeptidase regulatory-like domain-containing protein [Acidobacteriaceae bacterium]|nr:carboxypeptidase regulatory-like domain-containing protein [Acidobacteriaceae bacterium]